jgi:hypothetical protein
MGINEETHLSVPTEELLPTLNGVDLVWMTEVQCQILTGQILHSLSWLFSWNMLDADEVPVAFRREWKLIVDVNVTH